MLQTGRIGCIVFLSGLLHFYFNNLFAQTSPHVVPFYALNDTHWADSVFQKLSPDERIAQLFVVSAYSSNERGHSKATKKKINEIKKLVRDYKIGGLIFFKGGPVRQAKLTNVYQKLSKVPLLITMDAEWGLAMRLDSTVQFPRQMSLGAIQDDSLIYQMGAEIARQCKRIGVNVDFAPVVDVNSNPLNPVISNRSFGENKYLVAQKALMYMEGLQDNGVLANAKHFPGHGDTDSDSHKTLPVINHSKALLDSLDLYPFKQLFSKGLGSLMVAHLFVPSLDTAVNTASTLSRKIVTGLLKNELQFKGLIFTDALNMKGVSKYYPPGVVDLKALLAGNDILLCSENVPEAIIEIKKAIAGGEITQEEIDNHCRKILLAKQWCGLDHYKPVELKNLYRDLNTGKAELINRKLIEGSLTVLQNKNNLIPLQRPDTLKIAALSLGNKGINDFQRMLGNYSPIMYFGLDPNSSPAEDDSIIKCLQSYNLVIIQINNTNNSPAKNFGFTDEFSRIIQAIMRHGKTIINVSANPYILAKCDSLVNADAVIMSYEDNELTQNLSAQLIFGAISANGKLPVTASVFYKAGMGIVTKGLGRLKYTIPEELGIARADFNKIDIIALEAIKERVYPGCVVLVAKDGKVIYQKSFGYHTYDKKKMVQNDDIYDLASITKIAATTPAVMRLVEEKKMSLDDSLYNYLPELKGTNKQNISIREMMTHQAGLRDWIPFWLHTMKNGRYLPGIYNPFQCDSFPLRVAENLYIVKNYTDTIYKMITASEVKGVGKYKYSDLGYYYLKKIIEEKRNVTLDKYVSETFYRPLGLSTMGYKPMDRFDLSRIPPTEYDVQFRKQLVHGDVHDQGAAMLGGVGGHAGLFSDANDLAVLMQMYLQKGEYAGVRYLDSAVVSEFTRCQYCLNNRRALGFDKPDENSSGGNPVCDCVSPLSYGHSGFTGTLTWVDPAKNLVYVFLSNRVYPSAEINKLAKKGIRTKIQEVIYNAIK
jgi:beta-N-acetylhexosaminidase